MNVVNTNSTMTPGTEVRVLAASLVAQVMAGKRSLKAVLQQNISDLKDPRDRALLEAICFTTLRHHRYYEFVLSQWLSKPLPRKDYPIQCLLLCGLAQLHGMKMPAHAVVSASVDAAKQVGQESQAKLVNAILRRATREALPTSSNQAIQSSHPDWLIKQLQNEWPEYYNAMLWANNEAAPLWLRANSARSSRTDILAAFADAKIECDAPDFPNMSIRVHEHQALSTLPGWDAGNFSVQDGAAQLAVEALSITPGSYVLDACAAPGGKTAQLAEHIAGGRILALDIAQARLTPINETLERLGLLSENIDVKTGDATDPESWWNGELFDAILLDAPCSATGIIRRQPDIKWHRKAEDIEKMTGLQARLLRALWPLLKPGGRMLYCTCSVLKVENQFQINSFVSDNKDAEVLVLDEKFGHASGLGRQRFPGEDGMDGFFYALLQKQL
jgi:16S rRNA (cytosine967-C5)-methyltransferase